LLERLGSGGMGDVYLARELASERLVAMKFLRYPGNQEAIERFTTELRSQVKLEHDHIVRVLAPDFLRADPFFTMEYMPGGSLAGVLKRITRFAPDEAVKLVRKIAAAVAHAHAHNVIHRDLKPSNVLLTADLATGGTPKVADFGLAKRLDELDPLTRASGGMGTPSYMPPEQISRKNGEIGTWSDVYGLGATLYHLLTGRPPFVGETEPEIINQVLAYAPLRVRALQPDIPLALEAVVMKCLRKEPTERYQTVADFLADLDNYEAKRKTVAPEHTWVYRAKQWIVRNRIRLVVGAVLVAASVGLVAAGRAGAPVPQPEQVFVPTQPPDPAEEREKRRKAIHADLLAGKSVTLVGEKGEPRWYEEPTGRIPFDANPTRTDTEPGGCFFKSLGFTLLKLLDPPVDRYSVELQIQHVLGKQSPAPTLGFFCCYDAVKTPDNWTEHRFLSVGFNDLDRRPALQDPPAPSGVECGSYCFAAPPGRFPSQNRLTYGREREFAARKTFPGTWRKIVVDVSPERLVVTWEPLPGAAETLVDVSLADLDTHRREHDKVLDVQHMLNGHRYTELPTWSPRRGIGVWALGAEVAVKNVVITPNK
jgi:hypothetical protein